MGFGPRIVRFLVSLFGYSAVQWSSGCWVRALIWDALFLLYILFIFHLPWWIVFALLLAQSIDAATLEPRVDRSQGAYAVTSLIAMCGLALVATVARGVWVEAFKIPSGSSIPNLLVGDHIFVDKTAVHPKRGENAVFLEPRERNKDFIKRIVAVGGDTIEIRDNALILNGQPVQRTHVDEPCEYDDYDATMERWEKRHCDAWDETLDGRTYRVVFDPDYHGRDLPATKLAPDTYFALGDNRDNSFDSRMFGAVEQKLMKGVARTIWFSEGPNGARWDRMDQPVR